MIRIELPSLFEKLGSVSKVAIEEAAALCIENQNREVGIIHFLHALCELPLSDFRIMLQQLDFDCNEVKLQLTRYFPQDKGVESRPVFSPLLLDVLQDSWLLSSTELGQKDIRSGAVFLTILLQAERYLPFELISFFKNINRETYRNNFNQLFAESAEAPVESKTGTSQIVKPISDSNLGKYTTNFTQMAENGELDPVLSRDTEINLMIDILSRRRKNNPIIVGDAGVGKSALIEGLAQKIVNHDVPEKLQNVQLLMLDLGLLQAGASIKGEFEKRLKGIIDEVKESPTPIILFIDEAHTLIGAGNQEGGGDAANLLKPALARGELRTIAATTWSEYKKYFEKDPALSRRFQVVTLNEPTIEEATNIMRGLHHVYEQAHGVLITDDALKAASALSARYVSGRKLPDKAIDVLDTACARIAINLNVPPLVLTNLRDALYQHQLEKKLLKREITIGNTEHQIRYDELSESKKALQVEYDQLYEEWNRQKKLIETIIELRGLILDGKFDDNITHVDNENTTGQCDISNKDVNTRDEHDEHSSAVNREELFEKLKAHEEELQKIPDDQLLVHSRVDEQQIASVISDWTGIPINQMNKDELVKITELPSYLEKKIKGQNVAIKKIHQHMLTSRADLRRQGRPKGSFLLVGPSGVGKTETALQIAELLYGGRQFLTIINMSEYQEKHTVSRLIGSPPGYVGYGEGGILTEAIRQKPYSIVLLDEVEKAHPEVLNVFYQAFDKGDISDGEGREIDCKNILFFLTSNLGYQTIVDYGDQPAILDEKLYPELTSFFQPALLARMEIVPYMPLNEETMRDIIRYKLTYIEDLLTSRYKADVEIDEEIIDEIQRRLTYTENGARMIESIIDGELLPPLSLVLLNKLAHSEEVEQIKLSVSDNKFVCDVI